ncbi:hypothetical protein OV450_8303, partial [Actinobacteria bacterium OV450]
MSDGFRSHHCASPSQDSRGVCGRARTWRAGEEAVSETGGAPARWPPGGTAGRGPAALGAYALFQLRSDARGAAAAADAAGAHARDRRPARPAAAAAGGGPLLCPGEPVRPGPSAPAPALAPLRETAERVAARTGWE